MAFPLGDVARILRGPLAGACARKIRHATYDEAEAHRLDVLFHKGADNRPLYVCIGALTAAGGTSAAAASAVMMKANKDERGYLRACGPQALTPQPAPRTRDMRRVHPAGRGRPAVCHASCFIRVVACASTLRRSVRCRAAAAWQVQGWQRVRRNTSLWRCRESGGRMLPGWNRRRSHPSRGAPGSPSAPVVSQACRPSTHRSNNTFLRSCR